jgi:hypothetical protein
MATIYGKRTIHKLFATSNFLLKNVFARECYPILTFKFRHLEKECYGKLPKKLNYIQVEFSYKYRHVDCFQKVHSR